MSRIRIVLVCLLLSISHVAWAERIDINTADAATLAEYIQGVGIKKAEAIVAYRKQHGPFADVNQLAEVQGIGEKTIEKNRSVLSVSRPE